MKTNLLILLCCCLVLIGNCDNQRKKTIDDLTDLIEDVSDAPAFKVGDVTITKYELDKNLRIFKDNYQNEHNKEASSEDVDQWKQEFLDRAYILAEAYSRGYGDRKDIREQTEKMGRFIVTQPNGLLTEKLTQKLVPSKQEITEIYEHQEQLFVIEYIMMESTDTLLTEQLIINDSLDFKKYADQFQSNEKIKIGTMSLLYPFIPFCDYRTQLVNLKAGEVAGPLKWEDNVFYFKILETRNNERKSFDLEYGNIKTMMTLFYKEFFKVKWEDSLKVALNIQINNALADNLWQRLELDKNDPYHLDDSLFQDVLDDTLIQYHLKGKQVSATVKNFNCFYNQQVIKSAINKNRQALMDYIEYLAIEAAKYETAGKMGIFATKKFRLDEKNYKNNLVYVSFEKELRNSIHISNQRIQEFYQTNKESYTDGNSVRFDEYVFKDNRSAMHYWSQIKQSDAMAEDRVEGLMRLKKNVITAWDTQEYPSQIIKTIFRMPDGQYTEPADICQNGQYYMFHKLEEYGNQQKSLEEMYDEIYREIEKKELIILKEELLGSIRNKFQYRGYY